MGLNNYFDHVYCINLDHRVDRWENCLSQFDNYGIEVERFSAVNGNVVTPYGVGKLLPGEVGVIRSNYNVIQDAKNNGYKNIVIFEDDVELCDDFNERFDLHYVNVPNDWKFLYMGGNHVGGLSLVNNKVSRINHTYAIHAICINEDLFEPILKLLSEEKVQVDVTYAQLQKIYPSYVFRPHLAWQKDGHSDIQGGYQNYDFLK
jgi:hypothetical protein